MTIGVLDKDGVARTIQTLADIAPFSVSVTPTVTNGAYSAGDIVGGLMTFAVAPANDQKVILEAIQIAIKANVNPSLVLILFNASPASTTSTDNSAYSLNAADAFKVIGTIQINAMGGATFSHGTPRTFILGNLDLTLTPVSGSQNIYGVLVDSTGVTLTSTSDVQVTLSGRGS